MPFVCECCHKSPEMFHVKDFSDTRQKMSEYKLGCRVRPADDDDRYIGVSSSLPSGILDRSFHHETL